MQELSYSFYNRDPEIVAKELLGKIIIHKTQYGIISGRIVEVEAYLAFTDQAAHSFIGETKRNSSLFKDAGTLYVHRIHMQHCIDVVTNKTGIPGSVLIRAIEPLDGVEIMKKNRNKENLKDLTTGPGKLTKALGIDKSFDGLNLLDENSPIQILDDGFNNDDKISSSKRIGISKAADLELRFYIKDNLFLSRQIA